MNRDPSSQPVWGAHNTQGWVALPCGLPGGRGGHTGPGRGCRSSCFCWRAHSWAAELAARGAIGKGVALRCQWALAEYRESGRVCADAAVGSLARSSVIPLTLPLQPWQLDLRGLRGSSCLLQPRSRLVSLSSSCLSNASSLPLIVLCALTLPY